MVRESVSVNKADTMHTGILSETFLLFYVLGKGQGLGQTLACTCSSSSDTDALFFLIAASLVNTNKLLTRHTSRVWILYENSFESESRISGLSGHFPSASGQRCCDVTL